MLEIAQLRADLIFQIMMARGTSAGNPGLEDGFAAH